MITTYDVRWACDVLRAGVRRLRRRRRPGVDRGRPAPGARHRGDHRRGARPVVAGRPAQPVHQDPGDARRACPRSPQASPTGISVNVTLIFSLERYRARHGRLPRAAWSRRPPRASTCRRSHSVASFFVSRVDTEIDKRLDKIGTAEAQAPARARPASPTPGWPTRPTRRSSPPTAGRRWPPQGAKPQRPLWASTGVKDPAYDDTLYVVELVAPGHRQHDAGGDPRRRRRPRRDQRRHASRHATATPTPTSTRSRPSASTYDDVVQVLEDEGVEKFEASWGDAARDVRTQGG